MAEERLANTSSTELYERLKVVRWKKHIFSTAGALVVVTV